MKRELAIERRRQGQRDRKRKRRLYGSEIKRQTAGGQRYRVRQELKVVWEDCV